MQQSTKFIGLDVHAKTIAVAAAEDGPRGEVRFVGTVAHTEDAVRRLVAKLGGENIRLQACYEAGCFGFRLHRLLVSLGVECIVISPSMIPRRPNDRVKTDRRDAQALARLLRAGELTPVWVPDEADEAVRDLVRARRQAREELGAAKIALKSFLLRHGRRFPGRAIWTRTHWRWIGDQRFDFAHQQFVFEELKRRIDEASARCERLDGMLAETVKEWSLGPVVKALQALRGVKLIVAATIVAEIGDVRRFANPKQLMSWLGLVPTEHSSGERRRQGAITRAGNAHARTMLIEASWAYRMPAREGKQHRERAAGLSEEIRAIAWKAQARLTSRFRRMAATGKALPKVVVAIARELCGFVWDIGCRVPLIGVGSCR